MNFIFYVNFGRPTKATSDRKSVCAHENKFNNRVEDEVPCLHYIHFTKVYDIKKFCSGGKIDAIYLKAEQMTTIWLSPMDAPFSSLPAITAMLQYAAERYYVNVASLFVYIFYFLKKNVTLNRLYMYYVNER